MVDPKASFTLTIDLIQGASPVVQKIDMNLDNFAHLHCPLRFHVLNLPEMKRSKRNSFTTGEGLSKK